MKILLINPNCGFQPLMQSAPLGLLSIATYVKERGSHVRIYDRNVEKISPAKVAQAFQPDVVGVSVNSTMHIYDAVVVSRDFRKKGIPVIWGGNMASLVPEMILREGGADYVVIGEGEITFHELIQAIEEKRDPAQIKGIVYLGESGSICRTPEREFADLADFPVIDWSFIDPKKYFFPHICCKKMMNLYASKGCPGRCAFCYNKDFHRSKCRRRPNEYVISEIVELATKHGMDGVCFTDDMFGLNKIDLYDLCGRLRDLNIVWRCSTRLGHLSREDLQLMYDAGCRWIFYGVESGSPEMLKRMHKEIDLVTVEKDFQYCREIGISATCGFVIGLPDETEEQLRDSVRLMLRLDANLHQATIFYPFPGTEFYDYLVEAGQLVPFQTLKEFGGNMLLEGLFANFSDVPTRDLHVIQCFFYWRSFFRKDFSKDAARYEFARNSIVDSVRHILQQGFFNMCRYGLSSARLFFTIAWYNFAYPGIRKKYGLYGDAKGNKQ